MNKVKKGSRDNPKHEAKRKARKKELRLVNLRLKYKRFKG